MPDISQTIRIDDEFSTPLKELTKASFDASGAMSSLAESIAQEAQEMSMSEVKMLAAIDYTRGLTASSKELRKTVLDYTKNVAIPYTKHMAYQIVQKKDLMVLDWKRLNVSEELSKAHLKLNNELTKAKWATQDFAAASEEKLVKALDKAQDKFYDLKDQLPTVKRNLTETASIIARYGKFRIEWFTYQTLPAIMKNAKAMRDVYLTYSSFVLTAGRASIGQNIKIMTDELYKASYAVRRLSEEFLHGDRALAKMYGSFAKTYTRRAGTGAFGAIKSIGATVSNLMKPITSLTGAAVASSAFKIKDNIDFLRASASISLKHFSQEFKSNMEFYKASAGVSMKHVGNTIKDGFKSGFKAAAKSTKSFVSRLSDTLGKAGTTVGGVFAGAFGRMLGFMGIDFAGRVMDRMGKLMLEKTKGVMIGVRNTIARHLDDISLTEKMGAMWGDTKGEYTKRHSFELANELGESSQMVYGLASKAAYEGIGTSTFERAMKLSDKIAALRPGETTENVASSLLENLKSGHSAGSMAQMLGGGQVMERQLKRSGFERALRKGDMQKALSIAEKIAEQAGLTEDKYKKANEGLAQDFQRVNNIIDNIKQKLGEIYSNQLASIVKRVREFLESDKFKKIMAYVEWGVKKVGSLVAGFVHSMLDNLHILGALLAGSFVIKIFMVARAVSALPMLFKAASKGAGLLAKTINFVGKITGIQFLKMFSWSKLLSGGIRGIGAAMKAAFFAHPIAIIIGAVGFLAYQFAKATGVVKSFGGAFLGVIRFVTNAINNLQIKVAKLLNTLHTDEEEEAARVKMNAVKEEMTGSGTKLHFLKQQRANARRKGLSKSEIAELDKQIKEIETGNKTLQERFDKAEAEYKAAKEKAELSKKTIEESLTKQEKGWTEGVAEAFKMSNDEAFGEIKKKIDKMLGIGADIRDSLPQNSWLRSAIDKTERWAKGIADNSNKIKDLMSQEEELRWLKAFSDRQIMSNYTYQTSTTRNVTLNGVSNAAMDSAAFINTRGRTTRPKGTGA